MNFKFKQVGENRYQCEYPKIDIEIIENYVKGGDFVKFINPLDSYFTSDNIVPDCNYNYANLYWYCQVDGLDFEETKREFENQLYKFHKETKLADFKNRKEQYERSLNESRNL